MFEPGYGLRYPGKHELPMLPTDPDVRACATASVLAVFHTLAVPPFALYLAGADDAQPAHAVGSDLNAGIEWPHAASACCACARSRSTPSRTPSPSPGSAAAGSTRKARSRRTCCRCSPPTPPCSFDVVVNTPATAPVQVYMGCGHGCMRSVDLTRTLAGYANGTRHTVSIPLQCFTGTGTDLAHVDVPFGVLASAPFSAAFADIRITAAAAGDQADVPCAGASAQ